MIVAMMGKMSMVILSPLASVCPWALKWVGMVLGNFIKLNKVNPHMMAKHIALANVTLLSKGDGVIFNLGLEDIILLIGFIYYQYDL